MQVLLCVVSAAAIRTLSPYQTAYRMNYRANARYAVDCTSTSDLTCQEYCAANNVPELMRKPDLEDWLDSWPDGCEFMVNSTEVLNTERSGFLREMKSSYIRGAYMSHSFLFDVTSLQNNGLPSHLNSLEFKSVFAVSVTSGDVSHVKVGTIPAQFCLIEGIVNTHEGAHCIAPNTLTTSSRYALIGGQIQMSIWPNVQEWGDPDYFVDEDSTYDPNEAGDRARGLIAHQVIWSGTIPLPQEDEEGTSRASTTSTSNHRISDTETSEAFASMANSRKQLALTAAFGERDFVQEQSSWADFLNPLASSSWLRARESSDVVDDTPTSGQTFTITVTIPLEEISRQWSGSMQIIKSKLTLTSSSDFKVRTGSVSEITPWYDSQPTSDAVKASDEDSSRECPLDLYACRGSADLVRHDPWFARDTSASFDVFYGGRRRCARDPISCPGKLEFDIIQESTRNLTFYLPRESLARSAAVH